MNMKARLYDLMCISLAIITAAFFALVTLFSLELTESAGGILATVLLSFGGALAFVWLFFHRVKGKLPKKIGFYVTHVGLVLLLVGFGLFAIFGDSISVAFPTKGDTYYSSVQRENGEIYDLGFNMRVEDFRTEYYEDGSPKQYYATLSFADSVTLQVEKEEIWVNKPIYKNGRKIYLMGEAQGSVSLLIREDMGENFVKSGAILIIGGCFCSLIVGSFRRKEQGNE